MDLNNDELERIYEALGCSISDVAELEASSTKKRMILQELTVLREKIGLELERRLLAAPPDSDR